MNEWAQGFFGRPIIDDWRRSSTSRRRSSAPADCISTIATSAAPTAPASRHRSSTLTLYVVNNHEQLRDDGLIDRALSAEDPDGRGGGALERHARRRSKRTSALPDGHDQGLRAGRAARGQLPADGDPRGAGPAFRRLQHRPLGLHQQRRRRDGVGSGLHQSQHRRHHDDLRLHAELRGSRATGGQHARSRTAAARCGRAAWSRTSRSARRPVSPASMEARGRRRPSASSGRAPAASGSRTGRWSTSCARSGREVGAGQPARPRVPAADLHARPMPTA